MIRAKEQFDEMIEVIRQAATESRMIYEVEGDIEKITQNRMSDSSGICRFVGYRRFRTNGLHPINWTTFCKAGQKLCRPRPTD